MLSCKDLVKLVSTSKTLNWRQKLEIKFHLLMCKHCSRYIRQLDLIKTGFKKLFRQKLETAPEDTLKNLEEKAINKIPRF